ncbi:MAG: aminomethyl transferase family protein [Armatimonadetes bacterium]|nr:aminomethyl transferase family protein [Anaerolineae bacterium]
MHLHDYHAAHGAQVAEDGIPLQYADALTEFRAAHETAILLDRSHEARLRLTGRDRAALLHRISTNDLLTLAPNQARATIFTSPTGRIIERALVLNHPTDALTLLGSPGRGTALADYLRRNIFFQDQVILEPLNDSTRQLDWHGPNADAIAAACDADALTLPPLHGKPVSIAGVAAYLLRREGYSGGHWSLIAPSDSAAIVWAALLELGAAHGLYAAGSLTFNALRIRAGRPGIERELSEDYIPLELGLWDEVSFSKGCYTGQEIIARMESRNRLAKTIVALTLSVNVTAPADLVHEGKRAGTLSSSVQAPDGVIYGIGVVKPSLAVVGQTLTVGEAGATITALPGVQRAALQDE